MNNAQSGLAARVLSWLAASVTRHPRRWVVPQLGLFVVSVLYTVGFLGFSMDRNDLISAEDESQRVLLEYLKEFPLQNELVVVVESENRERNRQFVERLGARLEAETNLFTDVFYKGDLKLLGDKALLFLPETELRTFAQRLRDYAPFIHNFSQASNLVSFFNLVNRQIRTSPERTEEQNRQLLEALPAIQRILDQSTDSLGRPGTPASPGLAALFGGGEEAERQMYITYAEGSLYLVTARPASAALIREAVDRLRQLIAETKLEVPGMTVGATGENILEVDEMRQSQHDSTLASVVAFILCAVIFVLGYRETGRPIKAVVCLLVGIGYTMGFTTLAVGHLNILTITFVPILIGLAIDFGVHLITRYEEELRNGVVEEAAMRIAMVYTGQGIFSGALTTAGAFAAMAITDFKGIREMGIICGGGILLSLVPMMTLLPVLLLRGHQNRLDHFVQNRPGLLGRYEAFSLRHPWLVISLCLALSLGAGWEVRRGYFDYNLLNMQSKDLPAVALSRKLIESNSRSVLFAALVVDSLEAALVHEKQLRELPTVSTVNFGGIDNLARYLTEDQTIKLTLVREAQAAVRGLRFVPADRTDAEIDELAAVLYSLGGYMGVAAETVGADDPALATRLLEIKQATLNLTRAMYNADTVRPGEKLAAFQARLLDDLRLTFDAIQRQDSTAPLRVDDLPKALRDRFYGVTGKYLLQIYPKEDVWEREKQGRFVNELRAHVPKVTGTPVSQWEYTSLLVESYVTAAGYALAGIVVLVTFHFRRGLWVLLSLLPVGLGALWTAGYMGLTGLPLNPANVMTLPLVVGIGVTNGIQILNRYAETGSPTMLTVSTGKAVIVSGMTTIAGFASLILGKHQGIQSLGLVMSIGVTACMVAALTVLPALLCLIYGVRQAKEKPSGDAPSPPGLGGTEAKTS